MREEGKQDHTILKSRRQMETDRPWNYQRVINWREFSSIPVAGLRWSSQG